MGSYKIKNVVFDIGNVIVRWSPVEIVKLTFGATEQPEQLAKSLFQSELWLELNRGGLSESEVKAQFQEQFGLSPRCIEKLFYYIRRTQLQLFGSVELLQKVKDAGYNVYALTDNVVEIVDYLKSEYEFWPLFDGTIVSAEVGCLKPQPEIFNQLLNQYDIKAYESVFIDDMQYNVESAKTLGFAAIQFENAVQCDRELKLLGLSF